MPVTHHDVETRGESASGAITGEEIRVPVREEQLDLEKDSVHKRTL